MILPILGVTLRQVGHIGVGLRGNVNTDVMGSKRLCLWGS